MKKFNKLLFIISMLFIGYVNVSAREINFYFYPNGGTTATDGFYVSDNGFIRYNDTSYSKYTVNINNINSISGKKFIVKKSGTSLVSGREWYFKNVYDDKVYFFSESKTYDIDTIFDVIGEEGSFISIDLYANWEDKKVSGIDLKSKENSVERPDDSKNVKATSISISSSKNTKLEKGTLYINKYKDVKNKKVETLTLFATISPSNASNKTVTWTTSNSKVATVDSKGVVTPKGLGKATITAQTSNGKKATYKLTVKKRVVIYLQASQGVRMKKWYSTHESENTGFIYSEDDNSLIYIHKSGSGVCFLTNFDKIKKIVNGNEISYGYSRDNRFKCNKSDYNAKYHNPAVIKASNKIKKLYGKKFLVRNNEIDYLDIHLFFGLSGNSLTGKPCDEIPEDYKSLIKLYSSTLGKFKELINSKSVTGYVVSIYPPDIEEAIEHGKDKWVLSISEKACMKGYVSAYKRYYANKVAKDTIDKNNYFDSSDVNNENKLKFIDVFKYYIVLEDEKTHKMKWISEKIRTEEFNTTDGQHMDESTTIRYTPKVFNEAGL